MNTDTTSHNQPEALRAQLADKLNHEGTTRTARIEHAFRTVPRHIFLSGTLVPDAYIDHTVITKRDGRGTPLVSASQPTVIAIMLEQLAAEPGHWALEVGTGYHTALLCELVGAHGEVTTIGIDPDAADPSNAANADFRVGDSAQPRRPELMPAVMAAGR